MTRTILVLAMLVIGCAPPTSDVPYEIRHRMHEWAMACRNDLRMGDMFECEDWAEERMRRGQFDD
jgi:hypothetical protein